MNNEFIHIRTIFENAFELIIKYSTNDIQSKKERGISSTTTKRQKKTRRGTTMDISDVYSGAI